MPINRRIQQLQRYFTQDIWSPGEEPGGAARKAHTFSRWAYLVVHGFVGDQCLIRASAMTYATILAIVPFFAVAFSISKGLGLQNTEFIRMILEKVAAGKSDVVERILLYIENTNVQTLGFVGLGTLLLSVFLVVGNVEKAFNTIWGVKGRTLWRKFTDFFSVTLVAPVVMAVSTSVALSTYEGGAIYRELESLGMDFIAVAALKAAPLVIVWVVFTFAYMFFPNARVRFTSALVGGIVAGTVWQAAQWGYIHYQVGVHKYNAIYGSFAQLPLFLIWMYMSWVIVLLGAEITYAMQHLKTFIKERSRADASCLERQKVAVMLLVHLTRRFVKGERPSSVEEIAACTGVPARLLAHVLRQLEQARMVVKEEDEEEDVYVLGRSPGAVRLADVMGVLATDGGQEMQFFDAGAFPKMEELFASIIEAAQNDPGNVTLEEAARLEETEVVEEGCAEEAGSLAI